MLAGLGGQGCRLAEIDGSAVAIVEVDCPDRQAERALVSTLQRLNPASSRPVPEVAAISAVSLREGRALLEVPVEGALTAKAWLAAAAAEGDVVNHAEPATDAGPNGAAATSANVLEGTPGVEAAVVDFASERSQVEVWAVMLQALRGLVAVHGLSDGSTHGAVCLANILVAARPSPKLPGGATGEAAAASARGFRRSQLGPPAPAALASPSAVCIAPEVVRGGAHTPAADVYAFGCALRAACCGANRKEEFYAAAAAAAAAADGKGNAGGGGSAGVKQGILPAGLGPSFGPLREALGQLLEKMLEEDPSRRCTALEALSSDYFRAPPLGSPNPAYPPQWSPFPVRSRRVSNNAPGGQPHWVAVALAAGGLKGDAPGGERGWFDSTYAVEVPLATSFPSSAERGGGWRGVGGGVGGSELESARIESLLQRSLPGARLHRLVRLQERARMLRFVCERDAAVSSAAAAATATPSGGRGAAVSRLFADPRDVVTQDALSAIAAPGAAAADVAIGTGGKSGLGWTVGPTSKPDEGGDARVTAGCGSAPCKIVRCTETAQFAAVAFAPPPTEPGGLGEGDSSNLRTLAIVRAIVGVPQELCGRDGETAGSAAAAAAAGGGSSSEEIDPLAGVDPQVDDLTRVGGIGLSSPRPVSPVGSGDADPRLKPAPGLSSPAVHSIKTWEVVGGLPQRWCRGGGGAAPVFTLRHDACYPEYLATFSL